ncbi:hypothetical protein CHLRE_01g045650v5 [Chlamydomonas reinhardtii]|uniref:Uncharacterized protein n=1 Tax=Chlamydomonas reinhardtii TaxID=3055 RepID=A8HN10_CHLRE|nr:uncharacterized protein CHLRE_01g045650v5 [Chlamydomonas reinhardtii]PNW88817.1 hypothetical protein CHLRE_01g045650v5 [Chlamydomonas reinhardtii]|eukprot:XP_001689727.1 DnaJ-like zinc-finger protein [Chlamydomonas reinhardtii]
MFSQPRTLLGQGTRGTTASICSSRLVPTLAAGALRPGHLSACRAKSKDVLAKSFDSEDELDGDLANELQRVADPERLKKLAQHFELAWKIARPGRPQTCDCCKGRKEEECNWCHSTGYLMVGSQVFPSTPTHTNNCPVCKGKGYIKCERCRGTGFRANWLPSDSDLLP